MKRLFMEFLNTGSHVNISTPNEMYRGLTIAFNQWYGKAKTWDTGVKRFTDRGHVNKFMVRKWMTKF